MIGLVVTNLFAVILGYCCQGKVAANEREENYLVLSICAALGVILSINILASIRMEFSVWMIAWLVVVPFLLYALGKRLRRYQRQRASQATATPATE